MPMMLSLYVTLGIFLLVAARNPSDRSVIAFAAWSSLLMLVAAAAFGVIGAVLTDRACSSKAGSSARINHRSGNWLVFHRESGDVHTFGWGPGSHTPQPLNGLLK